MEAEGRAVDGEGALPSRRIAAPLKGTKQGSAASGCNALSAHHHGFVRKTLVRLVSIARCNLTRLLQVLEQQEPELVQVL